MCENMEAVIELPVLMSDERLSGHPSDHAADDNIIAPTEDSMNCSDLSTFLNQDNILSENQTPKSGEKCSLDDGIAPGRNWVICSEWPSRSITSLSKGNIFCADSNAPLSEENSCDNNNITPIQYNFICSDDNNNVSGGGENACSKISISSGQEICVSLNGSALLNNSNTCSEQDVLLSQQNLFDTDNNTSLISNNQRICSEYNILPRQSSTSNISPILDNFICTDCSKTFTYEWCLQLHKRLKRCLSAKMFEVDLQVGEQFDGQPKNEKRSDSDQSRSAFRPATSDKLETPKMKETSTVMRATTSQPATVKNYLSGFRDVPSRHSAACPVCGRLFSNAKSVEQHIQMNRCLSVILRQQRLGLKSVPCEGVVQSKYISPYQQKVTCTACNEMFSYRKSLQQHMQYGRCEATKNLQTLQGKQQDWASYLLDMDLKGAMQSQKLKQDHEEPVDRSEHTNDPASPEMFLCSKCKKSFSSGPYLRRHIRMKHFSLAAWHKSVTGTKKGLFCSACNRLFSSRHSLLRHMRMKHCSQVAFHKSTSSNEMIFYCNECSKAFGSGPNLQRHVQMKHGPKAELRMNATATQMVLRKNRTAIEQMLTCSDCCKLFSSWAHVVRHKQINCHASAKGKIQSIPLTTDDHVELTNTLSNQRSFSCAGCGRLFDCENSLLCHSGLGRCQQEEFKTQQGTEQASNLNPEHKNSTYQGTVSCSNCSRLFSGIKSLKEHLKLKRCPPFAFGPRNLVLKRALKYLPHHKHTKHLQKKVVCSYCKGLFSSMFSLQNHLRLKRCQPKRVQYDEFDLKQPINPLSRCKRKAQQDNTLKSASHVKAVQIGQKRVVCSNCKHSFCNGHSLRKHNRLNRCPSSVLKQPQYNRKQPIENSTHFSSKNRKFACSKCHRVFDNRKLLLQHRWVKHFHDAELGHRDVAHLKESVVVQPQPSKFTACTQKKFVCTGCDGLLTSVDDLHAHVRFGSCKAIKQSNPHSEEPKSGDQMPKVTDADCTLVSVNVAGHKNCVQFERCPEDKHLQEESNFVQSKVNNQWDKKLICAYCSRSFRRADLLSEHIQLGRCPVAILFPPQYDALQPQRLDHQQQQQQQKPEVKQLQQQQQRHPKQQEPQQQKHPKQHQQEPLAKKQEKEPLSEDGSLGDSLPSNKLANTCSDCGKSFSNEWNLLRHRHSKHSQADSLAKQRSARGTCDTLMVPEHRKVFCLNCNSSFSCAAILNMHSRKGRCAVTVLCDNDKAKKEMTPSEHLVDVLTKTGAILGDTNGEVKIKLKHDSDEDIPDCDHKLLNTGSQLSHDNIIDAKQTPSVILKRFDDFVPPIIDTGISSITSSTVGSNCQLAADTLNFSRKMSNENMFRSKNLAHNTVVQYKEFSSRSINEDLCSESISLECVQPEKIRQIAMIRPIEKVVETMRTVENGSKLSRGRHDLKIQQYEQDETIAAVVKRRPPREPSLKFLRTKYAESTESLWYQRNRRKHSSLAAQQDTYNKLCAARVSLNKHLQVTYNKRGIPHKPMHSHPGHSASRSGGRPHLLRCAACWSQFSNARLLSQHIQWHCKRFLTGNVPDDTFEHDTSKTHVDFYFGSSLYPNAAVDIIMHDHSYMKARQIQTETIQQENEGSILLQKCMQKIKAKSHFRSSADVFTDSFAISPAKSITGLYKKNFSNLFSKRFTNSPTKSLSGWSTRSLASMSSTSSASSPTRSVNNSPTKSLGNSSGKSVANSSTTSFNDTQMENDSEITFFVCVECGDIFDDVVTFREHRLTVHVDISAQSGCGRCGQMYETSQQAKECFYEHQKDGCEGSMAKVIESRPLPSSSGEHPQPDDTDYLVTEHSTKLSRPPRIRETLHLQQIEQQLSFQGNGERQQLSSKVEGRILSSADLPLLREREIFLQHGQPRSFLENGQELTLSQDGKRPDKVSQDGRLLSMLLQGVMHSAAPARHGDLQPVAGLKNHMSCGEDRPPTSHNASEGARRTHLKISERARRAHLKIYQDRLCETLFLPCNSSLFHILRFARAMISKLNMVEARKLRTRDLLRKKRDVLHESLALLWAKIDSCDGN